MRFTARSTGVLCLASTALALASTAATASSPIENYALALSWEPAFCLTNPSKLECQTETPSRADNHQLSLHGLWPQSGSYCGVSASQKQEDENGQWIELPRVVLDSSTEALLQVNEPGTMSYLDRHEWTEHGTCSGYSQQDFFAPTLAMQNGINASNLGSTIASHVGGKTTLAKLQAAAAIDYGQYANIDIEYLCITSSGKSYLEEIRFHMRLPSPLPSTVQASYMAKPLYPASSSQLCKSTGSIFIRAVP